MMSQKYYFAGVAIAKNPCVKNTVGMGIPNLIQIQDNLVSRIKMALNLPSYMIIQMPFEYLTLLSGTKMFYFLNTEHLSPIIKSH